MAGKRRSVCGVGVNDADYQVRKKVNGESILCVFYKTWANMLTRCYNSKFHLKNKTYIGCSVCTEWHLFSNFKSWMETQNWQGRELHKDLLIKGNKVYSPQTCAFVDSMTNSFFLDCSASRGAWPIGVNF